MITNGEEEKLNILSICAQVPAKCWTLMFKNNESMTPRSQTKAVCKDAPWLILGILLKVEASVIINNWRTRRACGDRFNTGMSSPGIWPKRVHEVSLFPCIEWQVCLYNPFLPSLLPHPILEHGQSIPSNQVTWWSMHSAGHYIYVLVSDTQSKELHRACWHTKIVLSCAIRPCPVMTPRHAFWGMVSQPTAHCFMGVGCRDQSHRARMFGVIPIRISCQTSNVIQTHFDSCFPELEMEGQAQVDPQYCPSFPCGREAPLGPSSATDSAHRAGVRDTPI